jgi:hypothetical protein
MISANLVESNNTGFQTNQFSNKPVFRTNQIFKQTSFSNGTSFQKNAPVGFGLACRVGEHDRVCGGDTAHHHADAGSFTCARFTQERKLCGMFIQFVHLFLRRRTGKGSQETQTKSTRTLKKLVYLSQARTSASYPPNPNTQPDTFHAL